jgi:branched-chain amino acid transport system permease protein
MKRGGIYMSESSRLVARRVLSGAPPIESTGVSESSRKRAAVAALNAEFRRQDMVLFGLLFLTAAVAPAFPFAEGWMATQASLVIIYVLAAQGVSILTGQTGLVTVGHGGFLAIGAYTSALLAKYFAVDLSLALIAGAVMAGLIGCLLGLIFLRLAGPFMAIGTLGFAFFIGTIVNNVPIFEGRDGIQMPQNQVFGIKLGDFGFYYVALAVLALTTTFVYFLLRSPVGRAFRALKDSEKAAESSGINRLFYRTLAFTISASLTGIAGVLNANLTGYVSAETYGDIWYSVDFLVATVVGGSSALMGPFVGGVFIVMVPFFLEQLADFAFILKGVVLILMLQFAPAGVCDLIGRPVRDFRRKKIQRVEDDTGKMPPPELSALFSRGRQ